MCVYDHIWSYMSIQDRFLDLCGFVNAPRTWIFPWSQSDVNTLSQSLSYDWACPPMNEQRITGPQAKIAWSVVLEPGPDIFCTSLSPTYETATLQHLLARRRAKTGLGTSCSNQSRPNESPQWHKMPTHWKHIHLEGFFCHLNLQHADSFGALWPPKLATYGNCLSTLLHAILRLSGH